MRIAVLSAAKVAQQRIHQTVIAGRSLDDMAATQFTRHSGNPRMWCKKRGLLQHRLAGRADHRKQITHTFAAGDGHGMQCITGPCLQQRRRISIRPGAAITFDVIHPRAARRQRSLAP